MSIRAENEVDVDHKDDERSCSSSSSSSNFEWTVSDFLSWKLSDLKRESMVYLGPILRTFDSLSQWASTFGPYIVEELRASLQKEYVQPKLDNSSHQISFAGDSVTFISDPDPRHVVSFCQGVCVLSGSYGMLMALLGNPTRDRDGRILRPVSFEISFQGEYPSASFDRLRFLGPLSPAERVCRKLTELSEENTPTFMSDILTGIQMTLIFAF